MNRFYQPGVGRRPPIGLSPNRAGLAEDTADSPNPEFRPGVGRRGGGLLRVWGRGLVFDLTIAGYIESSTLAAKSSVSVTGERRVSRAGSSESTQHHQQRLPFAIHYETNVLFTT